MTDKNTKPATKELSDADLAKVAGGGKSAPDKDTTLKSGTGKVSTITLGPGGTGI